MTDGRKAPSRGLSKAALDRLVEEATVDAYCESEQVIGLFTMIDENLELPFVTKILGMDVTVERIDLSGRDDIIAICRRGNQRQAIPILDLTVPSPRPFGWEWIEAYRSRRTATGHAHRGWIFVEVQCSPEGQRRP